MSEITHVWRLVEHWRRTQRFNVSQSALAKDIGVQRSAVSQWKYGQTTPTPENLRAIQSATGIRYRDLLDALLQDLGYLPPDDEGRDGHGHQPAPKNQPPAGPPAGGVVQLRPDVDPGLPRDVAADQGDDDGQPGYDSQDPDELGR